MPLRQVIAVQRSGAGSLEQIGTKAKFWYEGDRALFKIGRENTGENWAEVVACDVAELLGLPHASYDLAEAEGVRGVTTPNFVPEGGRLILGNELIGSVSASETQARNDRREFHTVRRVYALTSSQIVRTPYGWVNPVPALRSDGVMVGYLLLDALVSNQDRHEENWGFVGFNGELFLAPTFDHASSLGRNESDQRRDLKLASRHAAHGLDGYAARAKSQLFDASGKQLLTIEAFHQFAHLSPTGASYWRERLAYVSREKLQALIDLIPAGWMSQQARDFSLELMLVNRRRILELNL
jgi:hypothetical protein